VAIQKINEIIKTEHQSSLNRPSRFTNAPPPLMSLHSGVTTVVNNISFYLQLQFFKYSDIDILQINRKRFVLVSRMHHKVSIYEGEY